MDQEIIEQDFLQAIGRIRRLRPRHAKLLALAKRDRLKLTIRNVALEAGHSRTHISQELCDYPQVRALILGAKDSRKKPAGPPQSQLVRQLRAEKKDLLQKLAAADSANARLVMRMAALERASVKALRQRNRRAQNDAHEIVGTKLKAGKVVPFPPRELK